MIDIESLQFTTGLKEHLNEQVRQIMDLTVTSTKHAFRAVEKFDHAFTFDEPEDIRILHNRYVDALFASHLLKVAILNASMIDAANKYDFMSYALAGRSFIEVTATLRYYLRRKIEPVVSRAARDGKVTYADLQELVKHEDLLLRGSRFDWEKFFRQGFAALTDDYSDWMQRKKKEGARAERWKAKPLFSPQVNAATALERWAEDDPRIGVMYDLFCELVHPNVGSTLCIASSRNGGISFQVDLSDTFGIKLFELSYGPLQTLIGKEFALLTEALVLMKFPADSFN